MDNKAYQFFLGDVEEQGRGNSMSCMNTIIRMSPATDRIRRVSSNHSIVPVNMPMGVWAHSIQHHQMLQVKVVAQQVGKT